MAEKKKYSTIHQHQPLRVPDRWDSQERMMVNQLEDILDDIYRRFGRIRLDDLNNDFRTMIETGDVNIEVLIGVAYELESLVAALGATTSGIDLVNKYLKIRGGGVLEYSSSPIDMDAHLLAVKNGALKGEHSASSGAALLSTDDIVASTEEPDAVDGRIWIKPSDVIVVNYEAEIASPAALNGHTATLATGGNTSVLAGTYTYRLRFPVFAEAETSVTVTVGSLTFTETVSAGTTLFDKTVTDASWYGDQSSLAVSMATAGTGVKVMPGSIRLTANCNGLAEWKTCTVKIYKG